MLIIKSRLLWTTCFFVLCVGCYSQPKGREVVETSLSDSFLIEKIGEFIDSNEHSYFENEKGYVKLFLNHSSNDSLVRSYTFYPAHSKIENLDSYPIYYSLNLDRPVLIFDNDLSKILSSKITNKSRRKLKRVIKPFLQKKEQLIARNKNNEVILKDKNFRLEPIFIHSAMVVEFFKDKEPVYRKLGQ